MRKSRIPGSRWFISCLLVVPLCTAITSHTVLAAPETFANTLFPNPVIPVGDTPGTLAAGDFNSDGRLDFAVANENSKDVTILLGLGGGVLRPASTLELETFPNAIIAEDFNNDGRIDLAIANGAFSGVAIFLGQGDGTFGSLKKVSTGGDPGDTITWIASGDFNEDGWLDIVATNRSTNSISILLAQGGNGTYSSRTIFLGPGEP